MTTTMAMAGTLPIADVHSQLLHWNHFTCTEKDTMAKAIPLILVFVALYFITRCDQQQAIRQSRIAATVSMAGTH